MKKIFTTILISSSLTMIQPALGQTGKGCAGPDLSTDHGGYCDVGVRFIDTAYFNAGDSVKFTYGASGSSCINISNNQIYLNGTPKNPSPTSNSRAYYTTITPGTYNFTWDQMIACDFTIELIENTPLSINSVRNEQSTSLFPNPGLNHITIKTDIAFNKMMIINITGEVIKGFESFQNEIDISKLTSGVYFIKLFGSEKITTKKFIKQ